MSYVYNRALKTLGLHSQFKELRKLKEKKKLGYCFAENQGYQLFLKKRSFFFSPGMFFQFLKLFPKLDDFFQLPQRILVNNLN